MAGRDMGAAQHDLVQVQYRAGLAPSCFWHWSTWDWTISCAWLARPVQANGNSGPAAAANGSAQRGVSWAGGRAGGEGSGRSGRRLLSGITRKLSHIFSRGAGRGGCWCWLMRLGRFCWACSAEPASHALLMLCSCFAQAFRGG